MTRPVTQHLSEEELESLLEFSDAGGTSPPPDGARDHLAVCEECEQKFDMHRAAQNALNDLRTETIALPPDGCADEGVWAEIAAGMRPDGESIRYLEHAAKCDRCGPLLRNAMADLTKDATPEEEALLGGAKSQTASWAAALAPKLNRATGAGEARERRRGWWRMWLRPPALAFVSMLLLATLGWWWVANLRGPDRRPIEVTSKTQGNDSRAIGRSDAMAVKVSPEMAKKVPPPEMVAMAYADYRTMEYRISGAGFAALHPVQRGSAESIADHPRSILAATQEVLSLLEQNPNNPELLDAQARLHLLDGHADRAIQLLQRARETDPNSPYILTDMATAYALRGDELSAPSDYGKAMDLLGQVLSKWPNDTVAVYNRALTAEKLHLYDNAIRDWTRLVQLEGDANWRNDGQARLDQLRKRRLSRERFNAPRRPQPHAVLAELLARPKIDVEPDRDVLNDELYLGDALTDWLPASLGGAAGPRSRDAPAALQALSDVMRERHHDELLADLISGPGGPAAAKGADELAAAIRANAEGKSQEIVAHARNAIALFHQAGNSAGEAAATYEHLSGANRSQMADRCARIGSAGLKIPNLHRYPWVESNLLFEIATCDFMTGKQEAALDYARRAGQIALLSRYKILELEGAWVLDGVSTPWVATADSWARIDAGLDEFWRYPYPAFAGEGFYSDLGFAAQAEGLWYCAEAVFQESVAIHSEHGDKSVVAAAHHLLAKAAEAAGDEVVAEAEYREASELLARLGNEATPMRLELTIERAAVEVRRNDLAAAQAALNEVAPHLSLISNHYALIPYLASSGELHLRNGDRRLAEQELWKAVGLIEQDKKSLLSDTDLLTWHRDTSQAYRSLARLYLQEKGQEEKAFSLLEWYRAAPLRNGAIQTGRGAPVAEKMTEEPERQGYIPRQVAIGARSGWLTWLLFPKSLIIFLLDESGLHTASVDVDRDAVELTAQRLTRQCADPLSDARALDGNASQLYNWLLAPVASHLARLERLVIEPDEAMEVIPFQVLKTPQGHYLGDMFSIIESPGIGYAKMQRTDKRITARDVLLAVGDPQQGGSVVSGFRPLPDASQEASTIAASFDRHFLFTGKRAVLANITNHLAEAEIFHFAGHAISDRNETGLVLAPATKGHGMILLDQEKLSRQNLKKLKLVVLSGCETGITDRGLIDPGNLVRVFLRTGVPNVVASKWRVDSKMSARLMEETYRRLLGGEPIENAMAESERWLRSDSPHPYYWAAFSVFGH